MFDQSGTFLEACGPLGCLSRATDAARRECAYLDEFDLRCTCSHSEDINIGHLCHMLVLELTRAELVQALGRFASLLTRSRRHIPQFQPYITLIATSDKQSGELLA